MNDIQKLEDRIKHLESALKLAKSYIGVYCAKQHLCCRDDCCDPVKCQAHQALEMINEVEAGA